MRLTQAVRSFLNRPTIRLLIAMSLFLSAIPEVLEDFQKGREESKIGVHHGALVYGFAKALEATAELVEGLMASEE